MMYVSPPTPPEIKKFRKSFRAEPGTRFIHAGMYMYVYVYVYVVYVYVCMCVCVCV